MRGGREGRGGWERATETHGKERVGERGAEGVRTKSDEPCIYYWVGTCPPRKTRAWKRVISPAAIGLVLVRATLLSMSLSHMSLMVHPAPRITIAPTANLAIMTKSGRAPAGAAMAMLQQHGQRSSHVPTGLSARMR